METCAYLNTLTLMNGTALKTSRRKTFVIGFNATCISFISLARYLFDNHPEVEYLLGYKVSQDHLETLFSRIRSRGGFNNNPDVKQFKSAMRSLMVKTDVTASSHANCLDINADASQVVVRPVINTDDESDPDLDMNTVTLEQLELSTVVTDIVEYIGKLIPH